MNIFRNACILALRQIRPARLSDYAQVNPLKDLRMYSLEVDWGLMNLTTRQYPGMSSARYTLLRWGATHGIDGVPSLPSVWIGYPQEEDWHYG